MTTRNVPDLPTADRTALEHLLGGPLSTDQAVFVMAFTPGVADDATRAAARQRLERAFAKAAGHAAASGIGAVQADTAVEEAMRHVRPRNA